MKNRWINRELKNGSEALLSTFKIRNGDIAFA
jgi:hypothetical protein